MSVASDREEYFKDVVYLVDCPFDAKHLLWLIHHHEPLSHGLGVIEKWEDEGRGRVVMIGRLGKMPVSITLWYAALEGKRVCFYESNGQVVDWRMIRKWLFARTKHIVDERGCWADTDVANFHSVIHFVH